MSETCRECGETLGRRNQTGLCRKCYDRQRKTTAHYNQGRTCCDCGTAITNGSKSGRCQSCATRQHHRTNPKKPVVRITQNTAHASLPCNRCGCPTSAATRVCSDCRAFLQEHEGVERWAS